MGVQGEIILQTENYYKIDVDKLRLIKVDSELLRKLKFKNYTSGQVEVIPFIAFHQLGIK